MVKPTALIKRTDVGGVSGVRRRSGVVVWPEERHRRNHAPIGVAGTYLSPSATTGHSFIGTSDYATNRDYDSTVLGATFQYTAIPAAGVGRLARVGSHADFSWRQYVRWTFGDVRDKGDRTDLEDRVDFSDRYASSGQDSSSARTRARTWVSSSSSRPKRGRTPTSTGRSTCHPTTSPRSG